MKRCAGLDLAALEKNPSGYFFKRGKILFSDEEILKMVERDGIEILAVDSPLSLSKGGYRSCDRAIRNLGIRILPLSVPSMRMLTKRGVRLKERLERMGVRVIETYPHAVIVLDEGARRVFNRVKGTKHEKDAAVCRWVAVAYSRGKARGFGKVHKIWI